MRLRVALLAVAAALPCAAAEPRWIRIVSPHFEIYSSAGAGAARDSLRDFERVRSFFYQMSGHAPSRPVPLRIVAFGSAKEYDAVRINEFAAAFYQSTSDRDFIVMGPGTVGTAQTAIHEYVHLIVRHSNLTLPPWLNEGIAELYSTIKPMGDKVLVGSLIPGRQLALLNDPWVPLATIVAADHDSPYYNEKSKAGSLYNEGWALTHMLVLRDGFRPKFPDLLLALKDGADTPDAFRKVYGKSVAEIERELRVYLRGDRFQGALIPAKMEKVNEKLEPEPAAAFDVQLTLAMIGNRPARQAESRRRFAELAAEDPKRPEPHAEVAYLDWRSGRSKDAIPEFDKAYALGERGARFLWDYGRLSESDPAKAIPILQQLLAQEPDRMEVRLEIAETQLRSRHANEALQTLATVRQVTRSEAPRFFKVSALAEWQAGHGENARAAAENFRKNAIGAVEQADADRLLATMRERPQAPPSPRADDLPPTYQPRLRRPDPGSAAPVEEPPPPTRPSMEGTFERLDCAGKQARFTVRTSDGVRTLLIEDPTRVVVSSASGGTVELTCGAQAKPPRVSVEFDPPDRIRAITFR